MSDMLSQWEAPRLKGVLYTFKTGREAYVKGVEVDFFFKHGNIPDFLTPFMVELAEKGSSKIPAITTKQEMESFTVFLDQLVVYSFVEPQVYIGPIENKPANQLHIDDVAYGDKLEVLNFIGKPTRLLQNFPSKQTGSVGPSDTITPIQNAPKRNSKSERMGESGSRVS
jgi:hypothetical protein